MKFLIGVFAVILSLIFVHADGNATTWIHRPPAASTGDDPRTTAVLIYAAGSGLSAKSYDEAIRRIQQEAAAASVSLWVAMPDSRSEVWTLSQFAGRIRRAIDDVVQAILASDSSEFSNRNLIENQVPFFYAGHSRGGILMQDLIHRVWTAQSTEATEFTLKFQQNDNSNNHEDEIMNEDPEDPLVRHPCRGLLLFASALQRKYRSDHLGSYPPVPVLTIGSELDGLFRVFRLAEAYYHQRTGDLDSVFVIRGASHMSFLSGNPTAFVRLNDLRPTKKQEVAHVEIAQLIGHFIGQQVLPASSSQHGVSEQFLRQQQQVSSDYFAPILTALKFEGSYNLKPPCHYLPKDDVRLDNCWRGSPWTAHAQVLMGKLDSINYQVQDDLWKVWLVNPVHLPAIHNSCERPDSSCTLNVTTVSQCTYKLLDAIDSGFTPIACDELRAKLKSRQSIHIAAGLKNANFTELDDNNRVCMGINQHAWNWALQHAPREISDRFYRDGIRLEMFEDKGPYGGGPGWIWTALEFRKRRNMWLSTDYVSVRSPTMRTPNDFKIKLSAGFHYCKLLSPARALEWIYHDGLRERYSLLRRAPKHQP